MSFFHCVWTSREIAPVRNVSVQRQRLAVGRTAIPVGIALAVAEAIEQRVGRGVVAAPGRGGSSGSWPVTRGGTS